MVRRITSDANVGMSPARAVVLGGSAGSIQALMTILPALPPDFLLPLFVVVHVPANGPSNLAELFRWRCKVTVCEAEDKQPIEPATVYFAPPNYHLLVENPRELALSSDEPVLFSRPSIDVLFESAADCYGSDLTAVLLSGANSDGTRGVQAVLGSGGTALVQAPDSAEASAMPQAAIDACPEAVAMRLEHITVYLHNLSRRTCRTP